MMHTFESNSSNVPAFLLKLWKIVEDLTCDDIIAWNDSGASFIIKDSTRMSKEILQCYFKHSNMASFIRQLNMYGFRKVINYEKSGLNSESNEMEFQHNFFTKGSVELLEHIKRKIPNTKSSESVQSSGQDVQSSNEDVRTDLSSIREKQENMDNMLMKMKQQNDLIWRELTNLRKKHKAQEHVIQKVIHFLVSIVQRSNQNIGLQRKSPCMLPDSSSKQEKSQVTCAVDVLNKKPNFVEISQDKLLSPLGPVIHEVIDLETEENSNSPSLQSTEIFRNSACSIRNENHERENHLLNTSFNASIPALPSDECAVEEFILGIPLEYINTAPSNAISIPQEESYNNVFALSQSISDTDMPKSFTASKYKLDDSLLPTELQTSKTIKGVRSFPAAHHRRKNSKYGEEENETIERDLQQFGSSCKLALSNSPNILLQSTLTKNSLPNHLTNIEKLNWLEDQIPTSSWNVDANLVHDFGLFSPDNVTSNKTRSGAIAAETRCVDFNTETGDFVGDEMVSGNDEFLQSLGQDDEACVRNFDEETAFSSVMKRTDKTTASKSAKYIGPSGSSSKQTKVRRPKTQKLQKAKCQKIN